MPTVSRQLTVNIQSKDTWIQLKEGSGGAVYTVPTSGSSPRADVRQIRAINRTGGSTTIDIAFSTNSTILDDEYVWSRKILTAEAESIDANVHVLRSSEGIWARTTQTSGSPNVTVRASLLEVT